MQPYLKLSTQCVTAVIFFASSSEEPVAVNKTHRNVCGESIYIKLMDKAFELSAIL